MNMSKRQKRTDNSKIEKKRFRPNYACRQIFNKDKENNLKAYLVMCFHMNYALTKLNVRKMAYKVAITSKKNFPNRWNETKLADNYWLYGFMERHSDLSLKNQKHVACQEQQLLINTPLLHFLKNLKMFMIAM